MHWSYSVLHQCHFFETQCIWRMPATAVAIAPARLQLHGGSLLARVQRSNRLSNFNNLHYHRKVNNATVTKFSYRCIPQQYLPISRDTAATGATASEDKCESLWNKPNTHTNTFTALVLEAGWVREWVIVQGLTSHSTHNFGDESFQAIVVLTIGYWRLNARKGVWQLKVQLLQSTKVFFSSLQHRSTHYKWLWMNLQETDSKSILKSIHGHCLRIKLHLCVGIYRGTPTLALNVMNFGSRTASNWTCTFTHPPEILHSTLLPSFADINQQTQLNQTFVKWLPVKRANNLQ